MSKRSVEAQTAKRIEGAAMDMRGLMALAERVMGNLPQSREFESVINDLMAIQHHGARIQEALGNSQEDLHDLISQQADDLMLTITQPGGLLQQLEEVRATC
ncbi:hypothetical protein ACK33C_22345 [Aeromonas hydrophila]|uniref:hypothetical protein n=1 Tax=Aeromonas TaxID=642 RepID=UPI002B49E5D9|nr:hypothetical protein [Aeromonas caviae]